MKANFTEWLQGGGLTPLVVGEKVIIRIVHDKDFDYLFCQRNNRKGAFHYAGIYCKQDGLLYDTQHEIREFDEINGGRDFKALMQKLTEDVRFEVEAMVGNDRKNLIVTETSEKNNKELETYTKYTAVEQARKQYLALPEGENLEPFNYECGFQALPFTDDEFLQYILDPTAYAKRLAADYFEKRQEKILFAFLAGDALAAAYASIISNPQNNAHIIRKIISAANKVSAQKLTVTMRRGEHELTFKMDANALQWDCGRSYSSWRVDAQGRRDLERLFGRGNTDLKPHEIVRITYNRSAIYEATQGMRCLHCEHEFVGALDSDELGWHGSCPECEGSFDVDREGGNE